MLSNKKNLITLMKNFYEKEGFSCQFLPITENIATLENVENQFEEFINRYNSLIANKKK